VTFIGLVKVMLFVDLLGVSVKSFIFEELKIAVSRIMWRVDFYVLLQIFLAFK
jgi:hypothetical protein